MAVAVPGPLQHVLTALVFGAVACGEAPTVDATVDPPIAASDEAVEQTAATKPTAGRTLTVLHPSQLSQVDLAPVERLDLALAESDRLGQLTEIDAATACDGLDLASIVARAPRLTAVRLSGCTNALASVAAFAPVVTELEIAEVEIDTARLRVLAGFSRLRTLTLSRVRVAEDLDPEVLRPLVLERIALMELERDSPLAGALEQWPKSLREIVLVGGWAGHDAMQRVAKAEAVTRLELRDTRVGNFSLNQIKPLSRLVEIDLIGTTFNDNSPLYFRDLPVTRFSCDCPGFGDGGLRTLRHCESVRELALRHTRVTGAGLAALGQLPDLTALELEGIDVGEPGFTALAQLPRLRRLDLVGAAADPQMPELGKLVRLEHLRLHYPELDDRAAPELAPLVALQTLDLSRTKISDAGLVSLAAMTQLRSLVLSHTRITNRGLAVLGELKSLEDLELDHTDLVDAAMVHVAKLQGLKKLRIDHSLVTDASVDALLQLHALERIDISGTAISPEAEARLATLPRMVEIKRGD